MLMLCKHSKRRLHNYKRGSINSSCVYPYLWILNWWQYRFRQSFWEERMLIWALVSANLSSSRKAKILSQLRAKYSKSLGMLDLYIKDSTYLCMELFCLPDHKLNQRAIKTIHGEHILIVCISIIAKLRSLQKVKYNCIFLANQ